MSIWDAGSESSRNAAGSEHGEIIDDDDYTEYDEYKGYKEDLDELYEVLRNRESLPPSPYV